MNSLIEQMEMDKGELSQEKQAALFMHEQLAMHKQMTGMGLAGMCYDLKEIRDKKHYLQLGYKDFCEYTQAEHCINERQAYKYIRVCEKLGTEFLHSSAKIGVTKLLELASLDHEERESVLESHSIDELAALKTEEFKKLTEENRKIKEQLTFLEAQQERLPVSVVQEPFDEIEAEIREQLESEYAAKKDIEMSKLKDSYEDKIIELKGSIISDDELKKFKENAELEAVAKQTAEMKKLKDELKISKAETKANLDAVAKETEKVLKAEAILKKAQEDVKRVAELEAKIKQAEAAKLAMEKQIQISTDPHFTKFKFMLESWQEMTGELVGQLSLLDNEKQVKMRSAIKAIMESEGL